MCSVWPIAYTVHTIEEDHVSAKGPLKRGVPGWVGHFASGTNLCRTLLFTITTLLASKMMTKWPQGQGKGVKGE